MLYSQTRQQVVRQDWRERKPAGAGGGESSLPEWGRTKDGNQEEKEKEVTGGGKGKIRTKIRKITTHFLIFRSGRKTKGKTPGKKGGKAGGWTLCHPDYTFILSHIRVRNPIG